MNFLADFQELGMNLMTSKVTPKFYFPRSELQHGRGNSKGNDRNDG
jgi:hypothetical protein